MRRSCRPRGPLHVSLARRATMLCAGLALVAGALGGVAGIGVLGIGPLPAAAATTPGVTVNFLQTASDGTVNNNDGYTNNTITVSANVGQTWPSTFGLTSAVNLPYGNTPCPAVAGCPAATATAVWQYGITPQNSGGLVANSSGDDSVTLTAPAGTVFPASASSYVLANACSQIVFPSVNVWGCTSQGGVPVENPPSVDRVAPNKVTIPVPFSVSQGSTFGVFVAGVANPAELQQGGSPSNPYQYPSSDFPVSTSASPIPGLPSQGLSFDSAGADQPFSTLAASQPTAVVGTANGVAVTATSLDEYGNPVNGEQISVVETTGSATPAPSSPQPTSTDQSGQESFTYVDTKAETATFTAYDTTAGFSFPSQATVTWVAGSPVATYSSVTATPVAVPADGTTASLVTVDLADLYDNPDLSQPITLTPESGTGPLGKHLFGSGTITPLGSTACSSLTSVPGTGCTGSSPTTVVVNGRTVQVAQVQFEVTDPTAETVVFGIDDLDQMSGGSFSTPPFTVQIAFGATAPTATTSTIGPGSQSALAGGSPATVTVTLRDANGNPVPGMRVSLAPVPGTTSHATVAPAATSGCSSLAAAGTTDCNGQAAFTVSDAAIENVALAAAYQGTPPGGTGPVTGSVPGTATVDFVAGPASPSRSTVTASPPSTLAGGATGSTVTVTLRDSAGNLAVGRRVTLSASGSSTAVAVAIPDAQSGCATQAPAGTTDCNGQAAFTVTDPTIEAATYTARDVTDSVSITETASVAFTAAPSVGTTTVTASPQSVPADGTSHATVTVTLRDAAGQPIPGKQLCLTQATGTVAGGGPCPAAGAGPSTATATAISPTTSGCPAAAAGTTNCHGQATFDVSATVAGQVTYGVVDTTDYPGGAPLGPAATVTFTPVPTEAGQSSVVPSSTVAVAGGSGPSGAVTVVVTLRDAAGAPISGHPVNLSAQAGAHAVVTAVPSGGTCATSPPDGTTNCDGQATFTVTDATSETVVFHATDTSTGTTVDQTATVRFVPDEQTASTVVATSPTAIADGGATPSGTDVVTVTLDPGIPLVGDQVALTEPTAAQATVVPLAIPTAASGCATAPPPGVSDCTGRARFAVSDTTDEAVTFTAVDTTTHTKIAQTVTVTFLPPPPVVTAVSPSSGPSAGGTVVTVHGTDLSIPGGTSAVTVGGVAASDVSCSPTTCTAAVPPSAAVGTVGVVVTTAAGASTPAAPGDAAFTYVAPGPTASSLSPTSGPAAGGTVVTIIGTHLGTPSTAAVHFGPVTVPASTVDASATHLTVTTPADVPGSVSVSVTVDTASGPQTSAVLHYTFVAPSPGGGAGGSGGGGTVVGGGGSGSGTGTGSGSGSGGSGTGTGSGSGGSGSGGSSGPGSGSGSGTGTGSGSGGSGGSGPPIRASGGATGYRMVAADGGVFAFGASRFAGSLPAAGVHVADIVGSAAVPGGGGYWMVGADGGVFAFGDAGYFGSLPSLGVSVSDIVGMAAAPGGRGYWLVASDGGVFAFGDAGYVGSLPSLGVSVSDIVGMAAAPGGGGYWLVASDGGVFAFGDAGYVGSLPSLGVSVSDIVGMAAAPGGGGYWLVASDGGVFAFGDATFSGSMGGQVLARPIVGMAAAGGGGYWLVAADGGVFAFGGAPFDGSTGALQLAQPIVAIDTTSGT